MILLSSLMQIYDVSENDPLGFVGDFLVFYFKPHYRKILLFVDLPISTISLAWLPKDLKTSPSCSCHKELDDASSMPIL